MSIPKSWAINKSFSKRLQYGRETEDRALILVKKYMDKKAYIIKGLDKGKDIVAPTIRKLLEVKDQRNAQFCLSVEFARKAIGGEWRYSAVKTTKADYWIWYCKKQFLVIDTRVLYELAKTKPTKKYPHRSEIYAMKIVKIDEVKSLAMYIWDIAT